MLVKHINWMIWLLGTLVAWFHVLKIKGLRKRHQAGAERCYLYRTSLGVHFFVGHTITHNRNGQEPFPPLGQTDTSHQHHQGQGTTSLNRRGWNGKVALSVCAKGVGGGGTCWPNSSCTEWVSSNRAEALLTNYFLKDSGGYIRCSTCRRLILMLEFWPELKPGAPGRALILKNPENDIGELSELSKLS